MAESAADRNVDLKTSEETKEALKKCRISLKGEALKSCDRECPYQTVRRNYCRNAMHQDALDYIETLESTYDQVSEALCGKKNATICEVLEAANQVKNLMQIAIRTNEQIGLLLKSANEKEEELKLALGREMGLRMELHGLKKAQKWHKTEENDYPEDQVPVQIAYKGYDIVTDGYWDDGFAE